MNISLAERNKYAEIFHSYKDVNGFLQGGQARDVFLNSGLPVHRLERIWELSDIDNDGQLDFDEFCVAMHLTYETLNNPNVNLPQSLPPSLIPLSKAQFLNTNPQVLQAQATGYMQPQPTGYMQPQPTGYMQPQATGYIPQQQQFGTQALEPEYYWVISPLDQSTYENIYSKYPNQSGKLRFGQMEDFYQTLPIPREELVAAWSLVDVNHTQTLTRDQTLVFLHILNQRATRGSRVPDQLPAHLRAAFAGQYAVDLGDRPGSGSGARKGTNTSMSTSALLADSYVNRLGVASTVLSSKGSTFNSFGAYDEEEHLKRELADLDRQVKTADSRSSTSSFSSSAGSTPRQQLQQLYDYKLRQLTERQDLEGRLEQQERDLARARQFNREIEARAAEARAQRRELERVLDERRAEIVRVGREIEAEGRA